MKPYINNHIGVVNLAIANVTTIVITSSIIINISNIIATNITIIIIKGEERKPSCDNPKRGYCDDQPNNGTAGDF